MFSVKLDDGSGGQQKQSGTVVKFDPVPGSEDVVSCGQTTNLNVKHQCITVMKEYENMSLEELRLEDYAVGRGPPAASWTLFDSTPSSSANVLGSATAPTENVFGSSPTPTGNVFGSSPTPTGNVFGPRWKKVPCYSQAAPGNGYVYGSSGQPSAYWNTITPFGQHKPTSWTIGQNTGVGDCEPKGSVVMYEPVTDTDVNVTCGGSVEVKVKLQCIVLMKEYKDKSLEELRLEDYAAGRTPMRITWLGLEAVSRNTNGTNLSNRLFGDTTREWSKLKTKRRGEATILGTSSGMTNSNPSRSFTTGSTEDASRRKPFGLFGPETEYTPGQTGSSETLGSRFILPGIPGIFDTTRASGQSKQDSNLEQSEPDGTLDLSELGMTLISPQNNCSSKTHLEGDALENLKEHQVLSDKMDDQSPGRSGSHTSSHSLRGEPVPDYVSLLPDGLGAHVERWTNEDTWLLLRLLMTGLAETNSKELSESLDRIRLCSVSKHSKQICADEDVTYTAVCPRTAKKTISLLLRHLEMLQQNGATDGDTQNQLSNNPATSDEETIETSKFDITSVDSEATAIKNVIQNYYLFMDPLRRGFETGLVTRGRDSQTEIADTANTQRQRKYISSKSLENAFFYVNVILFSLWLVSIPCYFYTDFSLQFFTISIFTLFFALFILYLK